MLSKLLLLLFSQNAFCSIDKGAILSKHLNTLTICFRCFSVKQYIFKKQSYDILFMLYILEYIKTYDLLLSHYGKACESPDSDSDFGLSSLRALSVPADSMLFIEINHSNREYIVGVSTLLSIPDSVFAPDFAKQTQSFFRILCLNYIRHIKYVYV